MALVRLLESNQSIPIVDLIDHKGYTLLHIACFKNIEDIVLAVIEIAKECITDS